MWREAEEHLRRTDAVMARLAERIGPVRLEPRAEGSHFDAVLRAIIYQQLSGRAAATIHGRLTQLFGGRAPTPADIQADDDGALRAAGLSRPKIAYARDLAAHALADPTRFESLHEMDDDAIIAALTKVKGIGRWSAHMFLIFRLGRPDVLPELDLGIRKGIQKAYGLMALPSPEQVQRIGTPWAPHRTAAAWYLWRSLDVETP